MSDSQSERYTVVNLRDQPVELYLGAESVTLPAYGEIQIAGGDLAVPQVESMLRRQLIDVRPVGEPATTETIVQDEAAAEDAAPDAEAQEKEVKESAARRTRRKS